MGGIAQQQDPRLRPAAHAIRPDVQKKRSRDLVDVTPEVFGEIRRDVVGHLRNPFLHAVGSQIAEGSLQDHPGHLEKVVGGWKRDQEMAAPQVDTHRDAVAVARRPGELAPDDVHRRPDPAHRKVSLAAHDRSAAVRSHDEVRGQMLLAVVGRGSDPRHPSVFANQVSNQTAPHEVEVLVKARLLDQNLQQVGLGENEGRSRLAEEVRLQLDLEGQPAVSIHGQALGMLLGQARDGVREAHLLERVDATGRHALAPELPPEIGLPLHQRDAGTARDENLGQRRTGRPAADDQHLTVSRPHHRAIIRF